VNNNWHLGFQMNSFSVGVIANHNAGSVSVYSLNKSASAHFDHIGAADTVGKTSTPLNNSVHTWDEGAFNMNKDQANAMNNGWGDYDMSSHNIIGDSTYLVNIGTESYKVAILKNVTNPLDSVSWTFRIAKLDGSNDVTKKVYKVAGGFNNRNFAYYNVQTDQFIDREGVSNAQWDMMFGKYVDSTAMGASKV